MNDEEEPLELGALTPELTRSGTARKPTTASAGVAVAEPISPRQVPRVRPNGTSAAPQADAEQDRVRLPAQTAPSPAVPAVPPSAADLAVSRPVPETSAPPTRGWPGFIYRRTGRQLPPRPEEAEERRLLLTVRRALPRPVVVTVANGKGGSGKTTTAIGFAAAAGRARGGSMLVVDGNENFGSAGRRVTAGGSARTIRDLDAALAAGKGPARVGDLAAFLRHHGEGQFDVLAGSEDPDPVGGLFDDLMLNRVLANTSRFLAVQAIDTGNNTRSSIFRAAIDVTDVLVVSAATRWDALYSASLLLDQLEAAGHGELVANAVTALTAVPGRVPDDLATLRAHFAGRTRTVVDLPYDPALDGGDELVYGRLSAATRRSWLRLAAAVFDGMPGEPSTS